MLLPVVLGVGTGILISEDTSHGVKLGAVIGGAAFMGMPMPVDHTAVVEARLRLFNRDGVVVWEELCLGEESERVAMTAVDRRYQRLIDKHLVRAIKKCNACLIGQLRQQFLTEMP